MKESRPLAEARQHLSQAEAGFRTPDGLRHLEEGLALLEEVALDGESDQRAVAGNLLSTYSTRICDAVRRRVANDPALPEPELEHFFRLLLAFDASNLELPDYVRTLKIDVVRRLVDRYYEGHPEEDKAAALRQLADFSKAR